MDSEDLCARVSRLENSKPVSITLFCWVIGFILLFCGTLGGALISLTTSAARTEVMFEQIQCTIRTQQHTIEKSSDAQYKLTTQISILSNEINNVRREIKSCSNQMNQLENQKNKLKSEE